MIEKIGHYSLNTPPTIYDEEALTALELAARTASKCNEVVEHQNMLELETAEHLTVQDKELADRLKAQDDRLPGLVNDKVQQHINGGAFDTQIERYAGNLEKRMDNLLGAVHEGTSTMDAEVIDIRTGADNVVYGSAGEAVRKQVQRVTGLLTTGNDWYKNLLNPAELTNGYYAPDGTVQDSPSYMYTGRIYVNPGDVIRFYHNARYVAAFDINSNIVAAKGDSGGGYRYVVPEGIYSVIVTISASTSATMSINKGLISVGSAVNNPYTPATEKVKTAGVEGMSGLTRESRNLIDPDKIIHGMYMSTSVGDNPAYCIVHAPCKAGESFYCNRASRFVAVLDNTGEVLYTLSNGANAGVITANADGEIFLTLYESALDGAMWNRGAELLPYEKGGIIWDETAMPNFSTVDMRELCYLPSRVVVAAGRTLEIYNNSVCALGERAFYEWNASGIGSATRRKLTLAGTNENVGTHTVSLTIRDAGGNAVWSGSTIVEVVPASIASGSAVVPIGDSWTNNKPWLGEVVNLSGGNVTFKGHYNFSHKDATGNTRTGGHEGRSGFSIAAYHNGNAYTYGGGDEPEHNVFWNPSTGAFDFAHYVANTLNGAAPSAVVILLGINGISSDNAGSVAMEKTMLDNIRASYPNMPVVVGVPAIPHSHDTYHYPVCVTNFGREIEAAFGGYENLVICPVSAMFDTDNNYPTVDRPVNPRSTQYEKVVTDDVHPTAEGYYSLADMVYSALCKLL